MSAIIVSLGAKTCSIATLSIMSLCIMTLIETISKDDNINDIINDNNYKVAEYKQISLN